MSYRVRYYWSLVQAGIKVIRKEGWRSFWLKFRGWLKSWAALRRRPRVHLPTSYVASDWSDYPVLRDEMARLRAKRREKCKPKPPEVVALQNADLTSYVAALDFPAAQSPTVSIIVPARNSAKATVECLASISRHTQKEAYQVILVDDGSVQDAAALLSGIRRITYIRTPEGMGFLTSCNRAAEQAGGEFMAFLCSDVQVTQGWLSALLETFRNADRVGAASPKILLPDGRLDEAGVRVKADASLQPIGHLDDPDLPRYNYTREVDCCSPTCFIIETRLFRELGGFDVSFASAYCAQIDLCLRLRGLGKRIVYNPSSVVVHCVSRTATSEPAHPQMCTVAAQQKLAEKWQHQIDALNRIRLIAFYLPQYHPIPENDRWWGRGFTEWVNVARARPNFVGHYQPHLPADLGFYDLRVAEVMEQQADLAKRYGIYGFCYFYYWFAGKRLLEMPLERMLETGRPDIPFCLCWANENWTRRWDGREDLVLIAQQHSDEDDAAVMRDIMRYVVHPNYIRIHGKPLVLVYRVELFPNIVRTTEIWRDLCHRAGIGEIYLAMVESFEHAVQHVSPSKYGFDASVEYPPHCLAAPMKPPGSLLNPRYRGTVHDYREAVLRCVQTETAGHIRFRAVMPCWDSTPRRSDDSVVFVYSSPGAYQAWLEHAIEHTLEQNFGDERIVFINAWNEWAEGNHLEPDKRYGHGFLEATRNAIDRRLVKQEDQP